MIVSNKNKYICISVPKTGTTSIQKFLLDNAPSAVKNKVRINGQTRRVPDHTTAEKLRLILGKEYADYRTIGFVRNPYDRIISSYYFYKKGAKYWRWKDKKKKQPLFTRLKILFAKLMPFKIWAILYPYKSNSEFLKDAEGNVLVTDIGVFDNLSDELVQLFPELDLNTERLNHRNSTSHKDSSYYFNNILFNKIIKYKIRKDLEFYYSCL